MLSIKYSLRYWLREDKPLKGGTCPLFLIVSVSGKRSYYNTGKHLHPIYWDKGAKEAVYVPKREVLRVVSGIELLYRRDVEGFNLELAALKKDLGDIIKGFELSGDEVTAKQVTDVLSGIKRPGSGSGKTEDIYMVDKIRDVVANSSNTHKEGTLKVYSGLANHIADYEKKYRARVTIREVDAGFMASFRDYLNFEVGSNNTTVAKQLSTLKTIVRRLRKAPYRLEISREIDDFTDFGRDDSDNEVIALTEDELLRMINVDLSGDKRLDQQRDVFLFAAATGLRYSDLADLNRTHIKRGVIEKISVKTGSRLSIPLNELSRHILNKYRTRLRPLPIISNDKCRKYIKEVAEICGIDEPIEQIRYYGKKKVVTVNPKHKLIGIHTGRKTFVTLMLAKGVPAQDVMNISSHKKWAAFQRYVHIADEQRKKAMEKGFGGIMGKDAG